MNKREAITDSTGNILFISTSVGVIVISNKAVGSVSNKCSGLKNIVGTVEIPGFKEQTYLPSVLEPSFKFSKLSRG